MLSNFTAAIKGAKDESVRKVLERLACHFALVQVRENGERLLNPSPCISSLCLLGGCEPYGRVSPDAIV